MDKSDIYINNHKDYSNDYDVNRNYKSKYYKYKTKYITINDLLKNQKGGFLQTNNNDKFLQTKNFFVRSSKRFPKMQDFYYKTDKKVMDEIYLEVLNKAIDQMGESHLDSLYDPVDSRHYCNYMAEKIYGGSNCNNDGGQDICNQWNVLWSQEIYFEPSNQDPNRFTVKLSGVVSGARPRTINFSNYLKELVNSELNINWIIMPVGVPGHSIALMIYKRSENNYELYFSDPNGPTPLEAGSLGYNVNLVRNYCKYICENELNNIEYKDYLLCDLAPQGGSTLRYIDSQGFCGAFTWMIIFMILINDFITPEDLYQYIKFRTEQWHGKLDTIPDYNMSIQNLSKLEMLKTVKINFNYFSRMGFNYNNNSYTFLSSEQVDGNNFFDTIDNPRFNLEERQRIFQEGATLSEISKYIYFSDKDPSKAEDDFAEIIRQISNSLDAEGKVKFRVESLNILKESSSFNWFENHILMYLLFVKEFFEEHLPMVVTADDTQIIDDNYLLPEIDVQFDLNIKSYCIKK